MHLIAICALRLYSLSNGQAPGPDILDFFDYCNRKRINYNLQLKQMSLIGAITVIEMLLNVNIRKIIKIQLNNAANCAIHIADGYNMLMGTYLIDFYIYLAK